MSGVTKPSSTSDATGPIVNVLVGPLKQLERAQAKTLSFYDELSVEEQAFMEEPFAKYVCDFVRMTCSFEDPLALALFFAALETVVTVERVKNKCEGTAQAYLLLADWS